MDLFVFVLDLAYEIYLFFFRTIIFALWPGSVSKQGGRVTARHMAVPCDLQVCTGMHVPHLIRHL